MNPFKHKLILFLFFFVVCSVSKAQPDLKVDGNQDANQIHECCEGQCCYEILARLETAPDSLKPIYDRLKELNKNNGRCCRHILHLTRVSLMDKLPWLCSVKKLVSVLGEPDKVKKNLTRLEKTDYGKRIPLRKRWFKKVYRYDGPIPGRIYVLIIIRFGRVIFWKVYADVC